MDFVGQNNSQDLVTGALVNRVIDEVLGVFLVDVFVFTIAVVVLLLNLADYILLVAALFDVRSS